MQSLRPKLWAPLVLVLGGAGAFAATQGAPVEAADHNDPPLRVHSATPTTDDRASDIADIFAWVRGTGASQTTVLALTFDGPNPVTATPFTLPCDRDVVYQIHITSDGGICPAMVGTHVCSAASAGHPCGQHVTTGTTMVDCTPSFADMHTINVRFAQNGSAGCFVQAEFAHDATLTTAISPTIAGALDTDLVSGSTHLYAGLRDDAFFFDLAGLQAVLTTGNIGGFSGLTAPTGHPNDTFAGQNTPAIVLEFPTSAITRPALALPPTGSTVIRVWASTARYQPAAT